VEIDTGATGAAAADYSYLLFIYVTRIFQWAALSASASLIVRRQRPLLTAVIFQMETGWKKHRPDVPKRRFSQQNAVYFQLEVRT